ncbi:hypothetical protein GOODEAATRI_026452 [Goodea atripinnis]|uniref:Uncharacterized protein n=1 Tax=Goodea atripinnis TaxID=208336 RepID=A0ABV0NXW2_9TELE
MSTTRSPLKGWHPYDYANVFTLPFLNMGKDFQFVSQPLLQAVFIVIVEAFMQSHRVGNSSLEDPSVESGLWVVSGLAAALGSPPGCLSATCPPTFGLPGPLERSSRVSTVFRGGW